VYHVHIIYTSVLVSYMCVCVSCTFVCVCHVHIISRECVAVCKWYLCGSYCACVCVKERVRVCVTFVCVCHVHMISRRRKLQHITTPCNTLQQHCITLCVAVCCRQRLRVAVCCSDTTYALATIRSLSEKGKKSNDQVSFCRRILQT